MLALTRNGRTTYHDTDEAPKVMRLYHEAFTAGDGTAALHEVDGPPPAPTTKGGDISALARERIATQSSWLQEAGFAVDDPIYAPGTRVIALGDQNFRLERDSVENMPRFGDAAAAILRRIEREERRDIEVDLGDITMDESGVLSTAAFDMRVEHGAFSQLALLAGFGMGSRYLARLCPPEIRSLAVGHHLEASAGKAVKLRTRLGASGERRVFSVVTPTYTSVDSDEVLKVVTPALEDARTEIRYDGASLRSSSLWMPDEVVDLAAGDIFKVGVRVETDDTGRGRIRVSGVVWRNLCLNLIIIAEGEVETVSLVHRGSPDKMLRELKSGVARARASVGKFLEAWGHARSVRVKPKETLKEWIDRRTISVPGSRSEDGREAALDVLLSAWDKEPGDTLADAVNAVTRAAHEHESWDIDVREKLEREAARLVLVPR
jgi:hypothetical protein